MQPLKPTITQARVTYAGGRQRTFSCTTISDVQRLGDQHHVTHGRRVAFLAADGELVHEMGGAPAAPTPPPRCRYCGESLRRIGHGFGYDAGGLFCSAGCGYTYAVQSIRDEERPPAQLVGAELAARRGALEAEVATRNAATRARLAAERARGAERTADMLAQPRRQRGGR